MMRRPSFFLFLAALTLIAASLACAGTSATPPSENVSPTASIPVTGGDTEPTSEAAPTRVGPQGEVPPPPAAPAIPERRRLTLEFPPVIKAGDSDRVILTLEMDTLGNLTPTAVYEGNQVTGGVVQIPNLYETHTVIAEARLDLAGVEVSPAEETYTQLMPGQSVTFYWSVSPRAAGVFRGTVWLHLRFVDKVTGAESRTAVSAQPIEIEGTNLLGFSGKFARTVGILGSVTGSVIGFPFFGEILKFLWGRRRKPAK